MTPLYTELGVLQYPPGYIGGGQKKFVRVYVDKEIEFNV